MPDDPEEDSNTSPIDDPEDAEMASYLDYTDEHLLTAQFMLVQLDKALAFSFSLLSGMNMDRYRRRKEKPGGEDYEAQIAAALVKKYQMRLSLEWMLASALIMGYAPMANKAIADRRARQAQKAREAQQAQFPTVN